MNKKEIRAAFRNAVFTRDKGLCVLCKSSANLEAHHITNRKLMPNGGYVKENGITVCAACHLHVEKALYSPEELYKAINSTYELALDRSKKKC